MTPDEAIAAVRLAASGRTRYERSEPWRDEVLVLEIERLRVALGALWHPLPPAGEWLRTRREGEEGENVCMLSIDGAEWIERGPIGRTTVTHHSFAAPTHWRFPPPPVMKE